MISNRTWSLASMDVKLPSGMNYYCTHLRSSSVRSLMIGLDMVCISGKTKKPPAFTGDFQYFNTYCLIYILDDPGDSLSTAHTGRYDPVLLTQPLHIMGDLNGELGAGTT